MNRLSLFLGGMLLTAVAAHALDDTSDAPTVHFSTMLFVAGPVALNEPLVMKVHPDTKLDEFDNFLVVKKASDLECPQGQHAVISISRGVKQVTISCAPGDE